MKESANNKGNSMDIVTENSPEAAALKTITGWVSRNGRFFGDDERAARYDGCTHTACSRCDGLAGRGHIYCQKCGEERDIESYNLRPKKEWNGQDFLYSERLDTYGDDPEGLLEIANDNLRDEESDLTLDDLMLVICEPVYASSVDPDYWIDDLPEDGELPFELQAALDKLNAEIEKLGPISWRPGKYAYLPTTKEKRYERSRFPGS